jgi:hypothetical protein
VGKETILQGPSRATPGHEAIGCHSSSHVLLASREARGPGDRDSSARRALGLERDAAVYASESGALDSAIRLLDRRYIVATPDWLERKSNG